MMTRGRIGYIGRARSRRGFTLVELVIVGALIALFSGLAIISIQQQYRSNQRKAIIAEARQVASAMDLAYQDVSFFPKLCWLEQSNQGLRFIGTQLFGTGAASAQIYNFMELNGRSTSGKAFPISQNWRGSYFALSQSRGAAGRSGSVNMIIPELRTFPGGNEGFRWPADVWGNPYVVYTLNVDRNTQSLLFINADSTDGNNPEKVGDYINAVVSYGPNRVPGGGDNFRAANLTADTGISGRRMFTAPTIQALENSPEYRSAADLAGPKGGEIANTWSRQFNNNAGLPPADLATSNDGSQPVGITDSGSDDIVFEF